METMATITEVSTIVGGVGAAVAGIAAWFSACYARKAAKLTQKAAEGQLLLNILEGYRLEKMKESLRLLRSWQRKHASSEFEKQWKLCFDKGDEEAIQVDEARRYVTMYFWRVFRLFRAKYVSEEFVRNACHNDGIEVLFQVIEPLARELDSQYDRTLFEELRRICRGQYSGKLIASAIER